MFISPVFCENSNICIREELKSWDSIKHRMLEPTLNRIDYSIGLSESRLFWLKDCFIGHGVCIIIIISRFGKDKFDYCKTISIKIISYRSSRRRKSKTCYVPKFCLSAKKVRSNMFWALPNLSLLPPSQ